MKRLLLLAALATSTLLVANVSAQPAVTKQQEKARKRQAKAQAKAAQQQWLADHPAEAAYLRLVRAQMIANAWQQAAQHPIVIPPVVLPPPPPRLTTTCTSMPLGTMVQTTCN